MTDCLACCEVDVVAMLELRAMVFCGYMPYGWLGPLPSGLSGLVVVAKDAVELTDARCCREDECAGRWLWKLKDRPSAGVVS